MVTGVQSYRYQSESSLGERGLLLQTSSGGPDCGAETSVVANPRFFSGFLTAPESTALGLLSVAEVAGARYYRQTGAAGLDPVVTGSRDRLRFESFSGCGGVYARLDVLPAGLDGDIVGHGTTNVDINPSLSLALGRVGGVDRLHVDVGPSDLVLSTSGGVLVERRVPLPARWRRGFAEVQVIAAGFDPRAEIAAAEAAALLWRLPSGRDGAVVWAVPAGRSVRLTSRPVPGAVCLAGASRLAALRPLLRLATCLRVYGPVVGPGSGPVASTWELDIGAVRMSVTLSPDIARGFSGEGQVLRGLAGETAAADADRISALLAWDPVIDVDSLATAAGISAARVRAALAVLGTAGQVGYDVAEAAYFHRVLPYDAARVTRDNPRLVSARALVAAGMVSVDGGVVTVRSGTEVYRVRPTGAGYRCTCRWWTDYQGQRGPCKHALAAELVQQR